MAKTCLQIQVYYSTIIETGSVAPRHASVYVCTCVRAEVFIGVCVLLTLAFQMPTHTTVYPMLEIQTALQSPFSFR